MKKLQDKEFIQFVTENDFICLTETFLTEDPNPCIFNDHVIFNQPATKLSKQGRPSGGVLCLVRKCFAEHVKRVDINLGNAVFILIDKTIFGLDKDVLSANVYIPPEGSPFYKVTGTNSDGVSNLEDCIFDNVLLDNDVYVILNGDLNSRTANVSQSISWEHDESFNVQENENYIQRCSQDLTINTFGKSLLFMCTALNLCILNGTCEGDRLGAYTFISDAGSSVIDYFVLSCDLYATVLDKCKISVIERTECKHMPVIMTINFPNKNTNVNNGRHSKIKVDKYIWDENKTDVFYDALANENFVLGLTEAYETIDNDEDLALDKFNKCMKDAAQCMRKTLVIDSNKTQNWFDQECRCKRAEVRKELCYYNTKVRNRDAIIDAYQGDDRNGTVLCDNDKKIIDDIVEQTNFQRQKYCISRREYKWLIERKKREYNEKTISKLLAALGNQRDFWATMRGIAPKRQYSKNDISKDTWFTYFKELLDQEDVLSGTADQLIELEDDDCEFNRPITTEEVVYAINKLKAGKAAGPDMIIGEMLKHAHSNILPFAVKFFNRLFDKGIYPKNWCESIILPLYKKGDVNDPGNYRGISLTDISSKIYGTIINKRIQQWADENNITGEVQAGFKAGYSTIDHVFTLMACVQKRFCNNNKRKLYVAFIDFRKCFDTINRNILWPILKKNGIKGKLFNCIRSMYDNVLARVRSSQDTLTEQINCTLGVKQGDICSPILFSLYINELAIELIENGRHGVFFDVYELFVLLLADDIILCSETVVGLQNQLDILHRAACKLHLIVNLDKSNIIVFRKGGYLGEKEKWFYDGKMMPVVNVYKYLGIFLSTRLSFSAACRDVAGKAKRALLYIIQRLRQHNCSSVHVFLKIFDTQVQPIMQYGSEIWGLLNAANECEKVHLYALKKYLNVDLKTPNDLVYKEMCRYPITINSTINCIRYWLKLIIMDNSRLPRKAYDSLYALDSRGKETWVTNIRLCLTQNGFGYAWLNQGVGNAKKFLSELKGRLIDSKWQNLNAHINESDRFYFYSLITTEEKCLPSHLAIDLNRHLKCTLTKFRFGISSINVHYFRYRHHNQRDLMCPYCKTVEENEFHLLMCCPLYDALRKQFLKEKYYRFPNVNKLRILLCSKNDKIIGDVCRFLYAALKTRDTYCS